MTKKQNYGFTLIEILISLSLGSLILFSTLSIFKDFNARENLIFNDDPLKKSKIELERVFFLLKNTHSSCATDTASGGNRFKCDFDVDTAPWSLNQIESISWLTQRNKVTETITLTNGKQVAYILPNFRSLLLKSSLTTNSYDNFQLRAEIQLPDATTTTITAGNT